VRRVAVLGDRCEGRAQPDARHLNDAETGKTCGVEAVGGVVVMRYGENPLHVVERVKEKIKRLEPGLPQKTLADGRVSKVRIVSFYDRTDIIEQTIDTLKEARWQADRDMFVKRAGELGARVLVLAANSDDTVQIGDVEKLITNRVDVLVIVPHDGAAMAKAVKMAHDAAIPVIAYDRIIRDADLDLYVSFDNERVGELQARFLIDHLPTPGKGRIVRIYGAKTDNNAMLFKRGQDRVLEPYVARGDIVIVHEDWAEDWKPENAKRIVNAAITASPGFDAVLASNDGTAGGAIQALGEEGLAGKVLVTGQDADNVALQRIAARWRLSRSRTAASGPLALRAGVRPRP